MKNIILKSGDKKSSVKRTLNTLGILYLVLALVLSLTTPVVAAEAVAPATVADAVLQLVNEARTSAGLNALLHSSEMQVHVNTRAVEISVHFEHEKPDGRSPFADYPAQDYLYLGENLQLNYADGTVQEQAQSVMQAFRQSPAHWANIMNPAWNYVAIGVYNSGSDGNPIQMTYNLHVVQWFSN